MACGVVGDVGSGCDGSGCASASSSGFHALAGPRGFSCPVGSAGTHPTSCQQLGIHASTGSSGTHASAGSSGSHVSAGSSGIHASTGSSGSHASAGLPGSHASAGLLGF
ncbi:sericin-1-like [Oncorhynchus masou masou]|uniref:sericin-1-like n=1 Tax=Oncorhynchus masou masou TaxID=90313 RepID=UPI00318331CC